jgi:hypothetical protein
MVSGGIAESDFCLCLPNGVRERAAAGHDDTPASAARQGADPISEMAGAGKTAAQLDHDDVTVVHLVGWAAFARCRRKQMEDFGNACRSLSRDFNPHPPGAYFDLLDLDGYTLDLRMVEQESGDALGECFEQWNVTLNPNQADAIGNNVIRENVAHILRRLGGAGDLGIHVETHALRM